jgi:hypothetical protein
LLSHIKLSKKDKENISTILLTSQLAYNLFDFITKDFSDEDYNFKLIETKNNYFGGSIMSAGLLVNNDLDSALRKLDFKAEKLIVPEIIYDYYGNDLLGKHYSEIEDKYGVEIILL